MKKLNRAQLRALWVNVLQGQGLDRETTLEILEDLMEHVPSEERPLNLGRKEHDVGHGWISNQPLEIK